MKLSLEIAKTHLLSKPKQTLVAMLGVTFGIGMFIAMVGLMTGLNNFTEELTMTSSPDIHIYNDITQERPTLAEQVNPSRNQFCTSSEAQKGNVQNSAMHFR